MAKSLFVKLDSKGGTDMVNWRQQISALNAYCTSKGWKVVFTQKTPNSDFAYPEDKLITIQSDRKAEVTFYYFLHEVGHMIMCQNKLGYEEKYSAVFNDFHGNSQTYKIARIEEELEAWKTGLRLARRLDLNVNRRNYEKIKSRCVTSYLTWAVNRKFQSEVKKAITEHREQSEYDNDNQPTSTKSDI
jgi:hypothetical protein